MKEYFITTGLIIAYRNLFEVNLYNIQKPSLEAAPQDHSQEYYSKLVISRKLTQKKKNEKTLAQLIRNI